MNKFIATAMPGLWALTAISVGTAAPAAAEPAATEPSAVEAVAETAPIPMPDMEGMDLKQATDAFIAIATGTDKYVDVMEVNPAPGRPRALSNWMICWQAPPAGEDILTAEWIGVGVARPVDGCW